jgi:hypothetical protein
VIAGLAAGILSILLTFVVVNAAFVGTGLLLRSRFVRGRLESGDVWLAAWTGYGTVILILIVWNFVAPVDTAALGAVLSTGTIGLIASRRDLMPLVARPRPLEATLVGLVSLWIANQSMAGAAGWDDGLYHMQSVQWAGAFPVVPGIANLHGPLAFNNASFLYDALLDNGWWEGRAVHVANGTLLWLGAVRAALSAARLVRGRVRPAGPVFLNFLFLVPTIYLASDGAVVGYSTDIPMALLLLAATAVTYEWLGQGGVKSQSSHDTYRLVSIALLVSAAVCVKSSAGVYAALLVCTVGWLWVSRAGGLSLRTTRTLAIVAVVVLAFAVPWMVRGVILSGYPIFPLPFGVFRVDWAAPSEHAMAEWANIVFTERQFSWELFNSTWLRLALLHDFYAVTVPLAIALAALAAATMARRGGSTPASSDGAAWLLLPSVGALVAWMGTAPSTRYCVPLFWALAAVAAGEWWKVRDPLPGTALRRTVLAGTGLLAISPLVILPARRAVIEGRSVAMAVLSANVVMPGPERWVHPVKEPANVTTFTTRSGLTVNVPAPSTTPGVRAKPWNAPLPTTPNPAPNLRLRASDLSGGFAVDGSWDMKDWPYYWRASFLSEWRTRQKTLTSP